MANILQESDLKISNLERKLQLLDINEQIAVQPVPQDDGLENEIKEVNKGVDDGSKMKTAHKLAEILQTFKELSEEVRITSSVQRHFIVLMIAGQYHQVILELDKIKISNQEEIGLGHMQKEMDAIFSDLIGKEKMNIKHSRTELNEYINKWRAMEYARAKKRSEFLFENEETTNKNISGPELEKFIAEQSNKIKADWCKARFEQFVHSILGRELKKDLDNVFGSEEPGNSNTTSNNGSKYSNYKYSYISKPNNIKTVILQYMAGIFEESELEEYLGQHNLDCNKIGALSKCFQDHV